jgi:hypothetical protein
MRFGNADGAKGCRLEITNEGDMARHWADYDHDNKTYSFHTTSACRTEVSVQRLEGVHASFERQAGKKAPGVDGIRNCIVVGYRRCVL